MLLGGETAEHPGQFPGGDFDMAGFAVGIAERDELWGPQLVADGDVLVGICSSGLHSNGFSLVRHLLKEHAIDLHSKFLSEGGAFCVHGRGPNASVGDVLLVPTAIYSPVLHDLGHAGGVHAAAHITGGGFPDNVGRAVPEHLAAEIDLGAWPPGPVFAWLHALGVANDEMLNTFNCGLGMVARHGPRPRGQGPRRDRARAASRRAPSAKSCRAATAPAVRYRGELRL